MNRIWRVLNYLLFTGCCRLRGIQTSGLIAVRGRWPQIEKGGILRLGRGLVCRAFRTPIRIDILPGGCLTIGADVFLNDGLALCCARAISIGAHTKIGDAAVIYDTDFHSATPGQPTVVAAVSIGKNVWIGNRAMILAGSVIGDHSVIGAGAIVRGTIPPRSIALGIPAKVVATFSCDDDWIRD